MKSRNSGSEFSASGTKGLVFEKRLNVARHSHLNLHRYRVDRSYTGLGADMGQIADKRPTLFTRESFAGVASPRHDPFGHAVGAVGGGRVVVRMRG